MVPARLPRSRPGIRQPARVSRASGRPGAPAADAFLSLSPRAIWAYLKTQPASFWFINAYLFFEYVRPQSIYEAINGPPWSQMTILLAMGALFMEGRSLRFRTAADLCLGIFTAVVLVSCATAISPSVAFDKVQDYLSWVLVILLIANIVTTERRFLVFMLAFLLYSFKMSQHATRSWAEDGFIFRNWGTTGAPGWFANSGELGIQMAIFFPLAVYFAMALRPHLGKKTLLLLAAMAITAITSIVASSSRGALLALGIVVFFMLLKARYKTKALLGVLVFGVFVWLVLPEGFRARFETVGEDTTSNAREIYWAFGREVMEQYPVLGIGFGNWQDYYERYNGYRALPHNILIEAGAELGYIGLAAFVLLCLSVLLVNWQTRQLVEPLREKGIFLFSMAHGLDAALVAFLVGGQFVTVLYYPFFWINLALTLSLHHAARHAVEGLGAGPAPPRRQGAVPAPRRAQMVPMASPLAGPRR